MESLESWCQVLPFETDKGQIWNYVSTACGSYGKIKRTVYDV